MANINDTLDGRAKTHGEFDTYANAHCGLLDTMREQPGWAKLTTPQRAALIMVQSKVARILNGQPDFADHWHDIAGYAALVERICNRACPEQTELEFSRNIKETV